VESPEEGFLFFWKIKKETSPYPIQSVKPEISSAESNRIGDIKTADTDEKTPTGKPQFEKIATSEPEADIDSDIKEVAAEKTVSSISQNTEGNEPLGVKTETEEVPDVLQPEIKKTEKAKATDTASEEPSPEIKREHEKDKYAVQPEQTSRLKAPSVLKPSSKKTILPGFYPRKSISKIPDVKESPPVLKDDSQEIKNAKAIKDKPVMDVKDIPIEKAVLAEEPAEESAPDENNYFEHAKETGAQEIEMPEIVYSPEEELPEILPSAKTTIEPLSQTSEKIPVSKGQKIIEISSVTLPESEREQHFSETRVFEIKERPVLTLHEKSEDNLLTNKGNIIETPSIDIQKLPAEKTVLAEKPVKELLENETFRQVKIEKSKFQELNIPEISFAHKEPPSEIAIESRKDKNFLSRASEETTVIQGPSVSEPSSQKAISPAIKKLLSPPPESPETILKPAISLDSNIAEKSIETDKNEIPVIQTSEKMPVPEVASVSEPSSEKAISPAIKKLLSPPPESPETILKPDSTVLSKAIPLNDKKNKTPVIEPRDSVKVEEALIKETHLSESEKTVVEVLDMPMEIEQPLMEKQPEQKKAEMETHEIEEPFLTKVPQAETDNEYMIPVPEENREELKTQFTEEAKSEVESPSVGIAVPEALLAKDIKIEVFFDEIEMVGLLTQLLKKAYPTANKKNKKEKQKEVDLIYEIEENSITESAGLGMVFSVVNANKGIYTFTMVNTGEMTYDVTVTFRLFEGDNKERIKKYTALRILPEDMLIFKFILPDAVFWDDEEYFSGSIEDSDSITKFNDDTRLIWREEKDH
jgi:hypothetical protein